MDEVLDYALEYLDPKNFQLYASSPNRRSHLALVVMTLLCESKEQIRELLDLAQVP